MGNDFNAGGVEAINEVTINTKFLKKSSNRKSFTMKEP